MVSITSSDQRVRPSHETLLRAAANVHDKTLERTALIAIVISSLCVVLVGTRLQPGASLIFMVAPAVFAPLRYVVPSLWKSFQLSDRTFVPLCLGWIGISTCVLLSHATQTQITFLLSNLIVTAAIANTVIFRYQRVTAISLAVTFSPVCAFLLRAGDPAHLFSAGILLLAGISQLIMFRNFANLATRASQEASHLGAIANQAMENLEGAISILHPLTVDIDSNGRTVAFSRSFAELMFGHSTPPLTSEIDGLFDVEEQKTAVKLIRIRNCIEKHKAFHAQQLRCSDHEEKKHKFDVVGIPMAGQRRIVRLVLKPSEDRPATGWDDIGQKTLCDALDGIVWHTDRKGQLEITAGENTVLADAFKAFADAYPGSPESHLGAALRTQRAFQLFFGPTVNGSFAECRATPRVGPDGIFDGFYGVCFPAADSAPKSQTSQPVMSKTATY